jgi:hypothetical protein
MQFHDQTLAQYSRFYLTMDLYAKVLASVFWIGRFRLKKSMILFSAEQQDMWQTAITIPAVFRRCITIFNCQLSNTVGT